MKIRITNKIWRTNTLFSGLATRNKFVHNALTTPNRTFSKTNSKFIPHFDSGSFAIPHPRKIETGGEDAVLLKDKLITVADGIGAWGPDAGIYSRKLVKLIGELHEENPDATPKDILIEADNRLIKEKGSST
jgi:hypothetical protein